MKIYIYDIEVFKKDWLVVFSTTDESEIKVIANDYIELKKFMLRSDLVFAGFNNKHYDDWVTMSMLSGADNDTVKAHNDFIMNGGNGWEFPFVQGQRKLFKSFDLRDDIADQGLNLKAIEGNINEPIVESSIPFDYPDKLTKEQLDEVIYYCKNDVKNTVKLYHLRKDYLEGKLAVGKLKGFDDAFSLSLTNPKLTATFLGATRKEHDDEFTYEPPKELILNKYKEPLEFYKTVDYEKKLVYPIAGLEQTYAWGGIHSAIEHYFDETTDEEKIVDIDVGSYYPSMMIQYNYISRNIPDAKGYEEVYKRRLDAKHNGNDEVAGALKLVLNSTYGAMKNQYNPLYDPRGCNHICITGQLFLTDLIEKLEVVKGFKLIQTNTDGLMIKYPVKAEKQINEIVEAFEKRTRLNFEYTEIHRIAQKDVNNYIIEAGATYLIKDGVKTYTKPDKHKISTKGGWVSLWNGGSFRNNSLVIVHKCLVNYFMNGVTPEKTVKEATNIFDFQMICKTGRTFDRTIWEVKDENKDAEENEEPKYKEIEVQRVNRVYAVDNSKYGLLYKCKGEQKNKLPDLPEHCYVDNENKLTLVDIDRSYYVNLAWKRIKDYKGEEKPKETKKRRKVKEMATTKLNLFQKLAKARLMFIEANIVKGGANRDVGYEYFELNDIIPTATKIFNELGLLFQTTFIDNHAHGLMYDADSPETPPVEFMFETAKLSPTVSKTGRKVQTEPQLVGAELTFYRRYLYMLALDICEHDKIEPLTKPAEEDENPVEDKKVKSKSKAPATVEERKEAVENMTGGAMTDLQKKAIKQALAELREVNPNENYELYIKDVVKQIKAGMTSEQAEEALIAVGNKIVEEKSKLQ